MRNPAVFVLLYILLAGCSKDSFAPAAGNITVVGNDGTNETYWKNRSETVFATSSNIVCGFVFGDDIYIGGSVVDSTLFPSYSKNGARVILSGAGTVNSLFVSDANVYAAGSVANDINTSACFWKDGIRTDFATGKNAAATSIMVDGTDVYVGGNVDSSAYYWKNGVSVKMPSFTDTVTVTNALFVSGSDVYMVGSDGGLGLYWKNQLQYPLGLFDKATAAYGTCITVSGSDVIVGGYQLVETTNTACYWVNGVPVYLENNAKVNSISTFNGKIYAAGHLISGTTIVAVYWIDAEEFILPHSKNNSDVVYVTAQ